MKSPGIGEITAFVRDIDRFATPNQLVAYFGAMPIEVGSGVDRDGKARSAKRYVMSRRDNDLVRRYLLMAALSAVRYNPALRALYARVEIPFTSRAGPAAVVAENPPVAGRCPPKGGFFEV
jgi:transposase